MFCYVVWFMLWINAERNQDTMLEEAKGRLLKMRGIRNCLLLCGFMWAFTSLIHLLVFSTFKDVLLSTAHLRFLRGFSFLRTWCAKRFNI